MTIKDTEADPAPWVRASLPAPGGAAALPPRPAPVRLPLPEPADDASRDEDDLLLSGWFAPA